MPIVQFNKCPVQDPKATAEAGKPVFGEGIEALVQIDKYSNIKFQFLAPQKGESPEAFMGRVPNEIRANYPRELEGWLNGQVVIDGTPIESMAWITPAQVANLQSVGINSAEGLANASDGVLNPLGMNGTYMRSQAKEWLEAQAGASFKTMAKENEELKAMLKQQAEAIAELQKAVSTEGEDVPLKRGPGRPGKKE